MSPSFAELSMLLRFPLKRPDEELLSVVVEEWRVFGVERLISLKLVVVVDACLVEGADTPASASLATGLFPVFVGEMASSPSISGVCGGKTQSIWKGSPKSILPIEGDEEVFVRRFILKAGNVKLLGDEVRVDD